VGRTYLLTGRPGAGKTTCLRRALALLGRPAGGFFTEEIREQGTRVGFALETLEGRHAVLAHVRRRGGPRVGKYGVDIAALDDVGVPAIRAAVDEGRLVVVDEIGKMEAASARFRQAVEDALRSPAGLIGTILSAPHPWADRIKADPVVRLIEVTPENREGIPARLVTLLTRPA